MKKKGNFRKVVSGLLAGMTMLSTVLSPMTAYAAEIQPEEKPPLYEEVKDLLDEDEVVTAKDYEIETGSVFAVSYTHLDVYKRQGHRGGACSGIHEFESVIAWGTDGDSYNGNLTIAIL